jgi:hypothetical protein
MPHIYNVCVSFCIVEDSNNTIHSQMHRRRPRADGTGRALRGGPGPPQALLSVPGWMHGRPCTSVAGAPLRVADHARGAPGAWWALGRSGARTPAKTGYRQQRCAARDSHRSGAVVDHMAIFLRSGDAECRASAKCAISDLLNVHIGIKPWTTTSTEGSLNRRTAASASWTGSVAEAALSGQTRRGT